MAGYFSFEDKIIINFTGFLFLLDIKSEQERYWSRSPDLELSAFNCPPDGRQSDRDRKEDIIMIDE